MQQAVSLPFVVGKVLAVLTPSVDIAKVRPRSSRKGHGQAMTQVSVDARKVAARTGGDEPFAVRRLPFLPTFADSRLAISRR